MKESWDGGGRAWSCDRTGRGNVVPMGSSVPLLTNKYPDRLTPCYELSMSVHQSR